MTKIRTLQLYRGTTAQNNAYTGSAGELTMDTTTNELRLHDGSTAGGHIIGSGGSSGGYHPDLFDCKWADHICNDVQWLRADTFSWQSGAVYQVAYQHLADDITGKTLQSETISGTTIQFYLADDGHKICPASEESNVTAIYNATDVAWYYIIDTVNQRFKLPRVSSDKAKVIEQVNSVPVKTSSTSNTVSNWAALKIGRATDGGNNAGDGGTLVVYSNANMGVNGQNQGSTDMGESVPVNLIADFSDINSFFSGKKYLYFFVGNFTQTAVENTAGLNAELFNGKVDTGHQVIAFQAPTAENNYTWCRKYADGWVEQGGIYTFSSSSPHTITLPQQMSSTNYDINISAGYPGVGDNTVTIHIRTDMITTTSFAIQKHWSSNNGAYYWQVSGMAA